MEELRKYQQKLHFRGKTESYLLLPRARCGHHAGVGMYPGALKSLCAVKCIYRVHFKKALCVWERERVIVCVLWCLLVVDLAQGSGFRSASSPRPYLSLHTELWSSSAFQMKCYWKLNTLKILQTHWRIINVTNFILASSLLLASYISYSSIFFLNYFIS